MVGVILAAGMGTRCKEITKKISKVLIPINGVPNIENNIEFLRQQNVEKIYIIIGYLKEQFYYLKDKYVDIEFIDNPKYSEYNNIYSMYLAMPYIKEDFIVVEGDVVIHKNFKIPTELNESLFYTMRREDAGKEWIPRVNAEGYIYNIDVVQEDSPSYIGIAYYTEESVRNIKDKYEEYLEEPSNYNRYFEELVIDNLDKIKLKSQELPMNSATEIDNYNDYINAAHVAGFDIQF